MACRGDEDFYANLDERWQGDSRAAYKTCTQLTMRQTTIFEHPETARYVHGSADQRRGRFLRSD